MVGADRDRGDLHRLALPPLVGMPLLVVMLVAPVVGPLLGAVLAWCSPRWSTTDKAVATSLPLLSLGLLVVHDVQPLAADAIAFAVGAVASAVLGPLAAAIYLAARPPRQR